MGETIQQIAERSTDGVFVCNPFSLKLIYVNDKFASFFKMSKEQLLEKPGALLNLLCTEEISYLQKKHAELITTGSISNVEFCFCVPGSDSRYFKCDAFSTGEEATGFVKDISDQKEMEAHYINHVSRAAFLLDNFEEQDNITTRKLALSKSRFDLLRLLDIFHTELKNIYPDKEFRIVDHRSSLHINIDSISFLQLLQHLIAIAVRFTPHPGPVEIITGDGPGHQFSITIRSCGVEVPADFRLPDTTVPASDTVLYSPELKDLYAAGILTKFLNGSMNLSHQNSFCAAVFFPKE